MLDLEVINSRLGKLEKSIQKLRSVASANKETFLADEDLQDKAERNFQVAVECCLDIGNHIISALGFRTPTNYADIFVVLGEEGILPREFAENLQKMAGFRNILVHDYLEIDLGMVHDNLQKLEDLSRFAQHISVFMEKKEKE